MNDWGLIWQAATSLLPLSRTVAFRGGVSGEALRRTGDLLTHADITGWLLPGLRSCRIVASLTVLPEEESELSEWLRQSVPRSVGLPLLRFDGPLLSDVPTANNGDLTPCPTPPTVADCGLIGLDAHAQPAWLTGAERGTPPDTFTPDALRTRFTHGLLLRRAPTLGLRNQTVVDALTRWAAFAAAYPERVVTALPNDAPVRVLAAQFFAESAGAGRTPIARQLRRVSELFAPNATTADLLEAQQAIAALVCARYVLDPSTTRALLAPLDQPLDEMERRDLIYLARAATPILRTLALARLRPERRHANVRATLEQSRDHPAPWVRAASQ